MEKMNNHRRTPPGSQTSLSSEHKSKQRSRLQPHFTSTYLDRDALSAVELEDGINAMCAHFREITEYESKVYAEALCCGKQGSSRASTPSESTIGSTVKAPLSKKETTAPKRPSLVELPPKPQKRAISPIAVSLSNGAISRSVKEQTTPPHSALDHATHTQTMGTFQHLIRGFSRKIDLGLLNVPRISEIVNESTRSIDHRRGTKVGDQGDEALDSTWLHKSPSRRLRGKRRSGENVSVPASIAKRERVTAVKAQFHQFVSANAMKEILAGTTKNTYHVTRNPFEDADEIDQLKLKAKKFQLRRGVFHGGVAISSKSFCAITFAPHKDQSSAFQKIDKTLRSQIAPPIRLRCLLVGELVRKPYKRVILGGHSDNPACRQQATTLTSLAVFQEERRKQLRTEQEGRLKSQRSQNASNMIAQMEYEQKKLMEEMGCEGGDSTTGVVEEENDASGIEMASLIEGNASDTELLKALLGSKSSSSSKDNSGCRRVDFLKKPETSELVQEIMDRKQQHDTRPYRLHPKLQESPIPGFTPYSDFQFIPHYLVVYEMPTVDPLLLKAKSEEALLRVSYQLKKQKDVFSALEFTTRWCSLIKDLESEIVEDSWVRRKVPFRKNQFQQENGEDAAPLTLSELLPIIGSGAVSIDVARTDPVETAQNPSVFYRHSFTFTDQWLS